MAGSTNLVVPLVMWGKAAPGHCVSCLYLLRDQRTMVTGSYDGQIIIWELDSPETWSFTPRHMLIGHTATVSCITKASPGMDCHHIVTSSESGEMSIWDTEDGACLESKKLSLIHTNMQAYRVPDSNNVKLFCCGFYEEICVLDPYSLEILFQLSSRVNPDWISAFHVLRPRNRTDDVVLALTISGTVKVWTLNGQESASASILENESKQIRCLNALSLTCCVYNMRTVLIVCNTYWNVYDAGDFTCLLSVPCVRGERWLGGEFISGDRLCCWSDSGDAYLYKLPTNCIVESKDFHNRSKDGQAGKPVLFATMKPSVDINLKCPPAFKYAIFSKDGKWMKYLLRGDGSGTISVWRIPDTPECAALQVKAERSGPDTLRPVSARSLQNCWDSASPRPVGILDHLENSLSELAESDPESLGQESPALTCHVFLPGQCRLVIGRSDGSIIMLPATQTIMLHLLAGKYHKYNTWPSHQILRGHTGRVNCLLYPNNSAPRYDTAHLVSGGIDFSVCLWDIYTGALLHRFSCHGGEVVRLHVPPQGVSSRIGHCVCGVASDHSVTLLSLKERRCVMLASRQIFPVTTIKWKPLDDFLLVGCNDGSVYVWQMESGHLDRVVSGMAAQDVLDACDEEVTGVSGVGSGQAVGNENNLANPALGLLRGIRHRNMAAIKMATQRGITQLQGPGDKQYQYQEKVRAYPMVVDGFRTNQSDAESHILFFDVEALIVQLLTEEYSVMSPGTMEVQGLTNQAEYDKVRSLTKVASPDTAKKITNILNKVKDSADSKIQAGLNNTASPNTHRKLTGMLNKVAEKAKEGAEKAKGELEKAAKDLNKTNENKGTEENGLRPNSLQLEINLTLEIGQLLLSTLHAWGLDKDLDRVALNKLGLLRPKLSLCFGLVSKTGAMSLLLPTWSATPPGTGMTSTEYFTAMGHWSLSHTLTTQHLLSLIAITNTLMSVSNASFVPEQERRRKLVRQATHGAMESGNLSDMSFTKQQEQIKTGWSLLSTLHCVLLGEKVSTMGCLKHKKLLVELLAVKWQDRCLQVRIAAQELLVAELKNLGESGRKALVDAWSGYIPKYGDLPFQSSAGTSGARGPVTNGGAQPQGMSQGQGQGPPQLLDEEEEDRSEEDDPNAVIARRNQTTAVILCGVIGALFDLEQDMSGNRDPALIALGGNLTRLTARALMYLVLVPSNSLSPHTPLRRAAIDLIGRGFVLWEPHLEVSKVLLGLLDMSSEAAMWVPSQKYGLPLTPVADCCRTARHTLATIALARPGVFITSVSKEIARYNTMATNSQTLNINMAMHVLSRSKAEILHVVEQLIATDTALHVMRDLLTDVLDIILHCVDHNHLKQKALSEVFPPIQTFNQISHCLATRRIAVGTKTGSMAMYELRASRVQNIPAHGAPITALAFNPDGKNLVTYSSEENKLSFWQTSTGMFGLGQAVTRCTKSYSTAPVPQVIQWNPLTSPRLVWVSTKTVTLLLPDGTETRFNC